MSNNDKVIKEEFEAIISDLKALYNASGKKVSGNFESGLEASYEPNKGILKGYPYLAGRIAGKMPPVKNILEWVKARGINPLKGTQTGLAWAIAKTIAKSGTNKDNHLKIYEEVITPERIQSILDKITKINIQEFVNSITVEMKLLEKNI